ncbi:MAG: aldo/keto reductase [Bacteroidota bacterium]
MKYRKLGHSGLLVSELCFGTMTFGGRGYWETIGHLPEDKAKQLVDMAIDAGVNFIDTADVYSYGLSEELLGKAIVGKRQDLVVATKVRARMSPGINDVGLSRHHIMQSCENSLKRLQTDYIDLYIIHSYDYETPQEETLRALDDLVRQGKVRYLGVSNHGGWHLMKALAISDKYMLEKFVSYQGLYSLASRDIETEIVPLCLDQGLGITPWSPLFGGFLSGKYKRGKTTETEGRRGSAQYNFLNIEEEKGYAILDVLEIVANNHGASMAQAALNYLLRKPVVSSVLIGANTPEQLADNLKTVDWEMSAEEVLMLDKVSMPYRPYPYWMLDRTRMDRGV